PQPRESVEVTLAVGVDDLRALAAHDDHWPSMVGGVIERMDQMIAVDAQDLIDVDEVCGNRRVDHAVGSRRTGCRPSVPVGCAWPIRRGISSYDRFTARTYGPRVSWRVSGKRSADGRSRATGHDRC